MSYLVYARKYRPKAFEDMIGQKAVVQTLQNAIRNDRVAQAYIFSGMRGVGKTTAARIFSKALNCQDGPTPQPCNKCDFCLEINEDRSMDVIEIDGASNTGVDEVRTLREGVQYKPLHCRYKVIIIDEIHMLSKSAFNALLKTLEEPPANTVFIFATTEFHKVPATIVSRCQHFEFRRITHLDLMQHLKTIADKENISISDSGLNLLAEAAEGSLRDAQSLLDQAVAFSGNEVKDEELKEILGTINRDLLYSCSSAVVEEHPEKIFALMDRVLESGHDLRFFHEQLIQHFRNLLVLSTVKSPQDLLSLQDVELKALRDEADKASGEDWLRYLTALQEAEQGLRFSSHPRIFLEAVLIRLCHFRQLIPLSELIEQIKDWKRPLKSAGVPAAPPAQNRDHNPVPKGASPAAVEENTPPEEPVKRPKKLAPPSRRPEQEEVLKDPSVQKFLDNFKAQILSVDSNQDNKTTRSKKEE